MTELADRTCIPCKGDVPPLKGDALRDLYAELGPKTKWKVVDEHHLERQYNFPDFKSALAFTNRVGELAEDQYHHPDIFLSWGKVVVKIWTHKIDGLVESDFIFAAKTEALPRA